MYTSRECNAHNIEYNLIYRFKRQIFVHASNFIFLPVQTLCAHSIYYAIFGHVLHVTFYGFE